MWSTVCPAQGSCIPCARSKLAICVHDGHIYILGGRNGNLPVRDFWKYGLTDHKWSEIKSTGDKPTNLQDHTMVGYKGKLYVFGGEVGFASTGETPLWAFDIGCNRWRKLTSNMCTSKPLGCRGHTAVAYCGSMHVYGGYRDLKGSTNELWSFDFAKETWRLATFAGNLEVPFGRHNHSVVIHDEAMWVYGGMTDLQARSDFWKWDFVSSQWTRIRNKGGPGELHSHTACKVLSSMILFGGERSGQLQNELWRFHFATEIWEKLFLAGVQPNARSRHVAVVVPTLILLLPNLYNDHQQQHEKHQKEQKHPEELQNSHHLHLDSESSTPLTPEMMATEFWEMDPHPRLPKSETTSNCRAGSVSQDDNTKRKIPSSFSHTNFKQLRERISTSNLFKAVNTSYMALSNSSDSVKEDLESRECMLQKNAASVNTAPFISQPNASSCYSNRNVANNSRLYGRNLVSVPNFQRIHGAEMLGLMEDLSDSSSVDLSSLKTVTSIVGHNDNESYTGTPKKGSNIVVPKNRNDNAMCHREPKVSPNKRITRPRPVSLDNERIARLMFPSIVAQDSLENIPDIGDMDCLEGTCNEDSEDIDAKEDEVSLKLIDLDAECDGKHGVNGDCERVLRAVNGTRKPVLPKSLSCQENINARAKQILLPAVNENVAWEWHRDFASCLNDMMSPDAKRFSDLEMKTFDDNTEGVPLEDNRQSYVSSISIPSHSPCSPDMDSSDACSPKGDFRETEHQKVGSDRHEKENVDEHNNRWGRNNNAVAAAEQAQVRHFSMLVFGGREQGVQGCGRRPITIWRLDIWK